MVARVHGKGCALLRIDYSSANQVQSYLRVEGRANFRFSRLLIDCRAFQVHLDVGPFLDLGRRIFAGRAGFWIESDEMLHFLRDRITAEEILNIEVAAREGFTNVFCARQSSFKPGPAREPTG